MRSARSWEDVDRAGLDELDEPALDHGEAGRAGDVSGNEADGGDVRPDRWELGDGGAERRRGGQVGRRVDDSRPLVGEVVEGVGIVEAAGLVERWVGLREPGAVAGVFGGGLDEGEEARAARVFQRREEGDTVDQQAKPAAKSARGVEVDVVLEWRAVSGH